MYRAARSPFTSWLASAGALILAVGVLLAPASVAVAAPADQDCSRADQPPMPAPGTPGATGFWARYREPLSRRSRPSCAASGRDRVAAAKTSGK